MRYRSGFKYFWRAFGGTFSTPNLLQDREGIATPEYPSDHDEVWQVDHKSGTIEHGPSEVSFWCALPKKAADCTPGNPEKNNSARRFRRQSLRMGMADLDSVLEST